MTTTDRFPLFWIEVDVLEGILRVPPYDDTTETIGHAAKHLHAVSHVDASIHKAFVFKRGRFAEFGFYRTDAVRDYLVATLTAMSDHRVRVVYKDGREEVLYL